MKKVIGMVVLLAFVGCKGENGAPGAPGLPGAPGASATSFIVTRNGSVTSNSIAVTVPGLSIERGDILAVYTCIGTACVQLNLYQAGVPNNMFYIAQGTTVTIMQAQAGAQTLWYITALEKV